MVSVRAAFCEQVERGAHHLRLAAEAVGVLDPAAFDVAGQDFAAFEQPGDRGGDADLARAGRAAAEMRGSNGLAMPLSASTDSAPAAIAAANTRSPWNNASSASAVAGLGAVDQREAFLRAELRAVAGRAVRARRQRRHDLAGNVDPAIAHQRRDQVRERREVARCADAALDGISGIASRRAAAAAPRSPAAGRPNGRGRARAA